MTPQLDGGIIAVTVILLIVLVGFCLFLYCVCNREDFERPNQHLYREISYKSLYDSESESSMHQKIGNINECGLVGLKKRNQECCINSIVQALASSTKIIEQFHEVKSHIPFCIALQILLELIAGLNQRFPFSNLEENTNLIKKLAKNIKWSQKSQQDGYELLSAIIQGIHQEMKEVKIEIEYPLRIDMVNKMSGLDTQNTIQSQIGLSIELAGPYNVYPGVTLDYLIQNHFSPFVIDGDPSSTSQVLFLGRTPTSLLFHIQLDKYHDKKQQTLRLDYFIAYSEFLSLEFNLVSDIDCGEVIKEKVDYKLVAVIERKEELSGSHYRTYRKFEGNWILADDERIIYVEFTCHVQPYILIYEKL